MKQRPQPGIGAGRKAEARSLCQDGEFSGGRGQRCESTPAGRNLFTYRVGLNQLPTALGFQGGVVCAWHPDAPCEQERGADGWMRHNEKGNNVSSYPLLAFSLREEAQRRFYSMDSSFLQKEEDCSLPFLRVSSYHSPWTGHVH